MLFRSNDTATTEIYTLSLHDALPISVVSIFSQRFDAHDIQARSTHVPRCWMVGSKIRPGRTLFWREAMLTGNARCSGISLVEAILTAAELQAIAHTAFDPNPIGRGYTVAWALELHRTKAVPAPRIETAEKQITAKQFARWLQAGAVDIGRPGERSSWWRRY